jgi:hypothetical protein
MNTFLRSQYTLVRAASQTYRQSSKRTIPAVCHLEAPVRVTKKIVERCFASSTSDSNKPPMPTDDQSLFERTVYVHPLSQIVLEYLQNSQRDFVITQGLSRSLTLHRDGSFELRFPSQPEEKVHRIWTSYDEVEKKHWLTVYRGPNVKERFLLQDNLLPAWNNNRKSLPERIHTAVDDMIRVVSTKV